LKSHFGSSWASTGAGTPVPSKAHVAAANVAETERSFFRLDLDISITPASAATKAAATARCFLAEIDVIISRSFEWI